MDVGGEVRQRGPRPDSNNDNNSNNNSSNNNYYYSSNNDNSNNSNNNYYCYNSNNNSNMWMWEVKYDNGDPDQLLFPDGPERAETGNFARRVRVCIYIYI